MSEQQLPDERPAMVQVMFTGREIELLIAALVELPFKLSAGLVFKLNGGLAQLASAAQKPQGVEPNPTPPEHVRSEGEIVKAPTASKKPVRSKS